MIVKLYEAKEWGEVWVEVLADAAYSWPTVLDHLPPDMAGSRAHLARRVPPSEAEARHHEFWILED